MVSIKRIVKSEAFRIALTLALIFLAVQAGWILMKAVLGTSVPLAYVPSMSMEPTLKVGDLVVIKGINPDEITIGDIVVFYVPGHYGQDPYRIVHRVVGIVDSGNELGFETKGDNNPSSDLHRWGHIPESHIVGIVTQRVPFIGYLAIKLREPLGILIIVLLVLVFIVSELSESKKGKK